MNIYEFVQKFQNYPVLFVGTGLSLRYLKKSYTWDELLREIAINIDIDSSDKKYLNLKYKYTEHNLVNFPMIAQELEKIFENVIQEDEVNPKIKKIVETYYDAIRNGCPISPMKLYIGELLHDIEFKDDMLNEIEALNKAKRNISSVITTNYDVLLEKIFGYNVLVGNDILLSNPYGTIYKIHGCVNKKDKIIITYDDYEKFKNKYELIRAQLLSLFIHHPIIFMGYRINDINIKEILKTIFDYIEPNSELGEKVRNNFLLVSFEEDSDNTDISTYDIELQNQSIIQINKIQTDNFMAIYNAIENLLLPVSVMDIRKVQNVVYEICNVGKNSPIKVDIVDDLEKIENCEKVIAIGSTSSIIYNNFGYSQLIEKYFDIIENKRVSIINSIEGMKLSKNYYLPIHCFSLLPNSLKDSTVRELKERQKKNIDHFVNKLKKPVTDKYTSINEIEAIEKANSFKIVCIIYNFYCDNLSISDVKNYLLSYQGRETSYNVLLSLYDLKKFQQETTLNGRA